LGDESGHSRFMAGEVQLRSCSSRSRLRGVRLGDDCVSSRGRWAPVRSYPRDLSNRCGPRPNGGESRATGDGPHNVRCRGACRASGFGDVFRFAEPHCWRDVMQPPPTAPESEQASLERCKRGDTLRTGLLPLGWLVALRLRDQAGESESVNTSAFVGSNPTGELVTSGLPVIRPNDPARELALEEGRQGSGSRDLPALGCNTLSGRLYLYFECPGVGVAVFSALAARRTSSFVNTAKRNGCDSRK
jgi:hypothetical protein